MLKPALHDPAALPRLALTLLALLLLWPGLTLSELNLAVLFDEQNASNMGHFLADFWPLARDREFLQLLGQATLETLAIATAGMSLALLIAVPAALLAKEIEPALDHRQRVGGLMRNPPHVVAEALLQRSFACGDVLAVALRGPDRARCRAQQADKQRAGRCARLFVPRRDEAEADALTVLMHRMVMPADQRKPELADAAERRLAVPFRVIEAELTAAKARGHAWLAADRFTVADLLVATVLGWARVAGPLMQAHPVTAEWLGRGVARPAFAQARAMA